MDLLIMPIWLTLIELGVISKRNKEKWNKGKKKRKTRRRIQIWRKKY